MPPPALQPPEVPELVSVVSLPPPVVLLPPAEPASLPDPMFVPLPEPVLVPPPPLPLPPRAESFAPSGVPMPVGPSQPAAALQSAVVHVPFLPVVTSLKAAVFAYANAAVVSPCLVSAKIAATSGDAAEVPPMTAQPPWLAL